VGSSYFGASTGAGYAGAASDGCIEVGGGSAGSGIPVSVYATFQHRSTMMKSEMAHFLDQYADRLNELLHSALPATRFYKQELIEVPGLLTAILVTHDGVRDDEREIRANMTWQDFLARMATLKPD
jgi:hypothetical protein